MRQAKHSSGPTTANSYTQVDLLVLSERTWLLALVTATTSPPLSSHGPTKFVSIVLKPLPRCQPLNLSISLAQYDASNPVPSHFTQVVWKGTTQVGCALQMCDGIFSSSFGVSFISATVEIMSSQFL